MTEETARAFAELKRAVAAQLGADPDECVMVISRPHAAEVPGADNTSCQRCGAAYFDESGCDPCPHCGASYFDQIFPGRDRDPRRHVVRLKGRRRQARRAALRCGSGAGSPCRR